MNNIFWIRDLLYRHYQDIIRAEAGRLEGKALKKKNAPKAAAIELAALINAAGKKRRMKRSIQPRWLFHFLRDYSADEMLEVNRLRRPEYKVNFDLELLELLHCYLADHGYPLDARPIFSPVGLVTPLAASKNVAFLMAVRPTEGFRNDIIAWDNRSMAHIMEALRGAGFTGEFKIQEVPLLANPSQAIVEKQEWYPLLRDSRTSLIAIGSPRASHASEVLSSLIFGKPAFQPPAVQDGEPVGVPFCFAWPRENGAALPSCCGLGDRDLEQFKRAGEGWARDVNAGNAAALFLHGAYLADWYQRRTDRKAGWVPVPRVPPGRKDPWEMFATVVAQRRKEGQIWAVISGVSGPATTAAALMLGAIEAALPTSTREHGPVMWGVVKTRVLTKSMQTKEGIGDNRILDESEGGRQFVVDFQEWPPVAKQSGPGR